MYRVIDLFAGAGGLSLGFKMTGEFQIVAAAEINPNARKTYQKNIPADLENFEFIENVIGCDFKALNSKLGRIDVVIGGPPCQGFSNANRQKNHLISMNNALVKEYFRAIKEIQPKVFVMENVSMLKSDIHRFFDSRHDHDLIEDIIKTSGKGAISFRDEEIHISDGIVPGFDMLAIAKDSLRRTQLLIPDQLFHLLAVLKKDLRNSDRLKKYVEKNSKKIQKSIDNFCSTPAEGEKAVLQNWTKALQIALSNLETLQTAHELENIVELQKSLHMMEEIEENLLIGQYAYASSSLVFHTRSYAVIDYINAVLGKEYIQHGATYNTVYFGVPQERKRHIVIGVRRDCVADRDFEMLKAPPKTQFVTVEEAISDLSEYEAASSSDCTELPYTPNDRLSQYAEMMRAGSSSVKNHFATSSSEKAIERFKKLKPGENFQNLPKDMIGTYTDPERTQKTIYLRLNPKKPSGTVVNVRKSMWIHPYKDRAISLREAARLQSFPDSFEFCGTKDSQYQQVGNAVPPLFARSIAEFVLKLLYS